MRSDIETLAAAGIIDSVTTQWPLPWGGILEHLERPNALAGQAAFIRAAALRVQSEGERALRTGRVNLAVVADATNLPDVVRGFDALGREDVQGQASAEWMGETTTVRLQLGAQTTDQRDHQVFLPDGSYALQRIGNAALYAGYVSHWWGPGWSQALSLSNNARPFPHIGITRLDTAAFDTPWLSWIGPWQAEFFVGVLDGKRIARNTLFNGLRLSISPFKGFEFALSRTEQLCGTGHPCQPISEFFNVANDDAHPSKSKDEVNFDLRYTGMLGHVPYAAYLQVMNRDTGPFSHSDSNHLFGLTAWVPVRSTAVRFTAEYVDTISTVDFFSFGNNIYGITYTDYKYVDGWQYRGRTMGASLDTDSRLAMAQASWVAPHDWNYTFTYYRAAISSPETPVGNNIVTTSPVTINIGEARVSIPLEPFALDVALRIQDDQPRPAHGAMAAFEVGLKWML